MFLLATLFFVAQVWVIVRAFKTIGELATINERLNNLQNKK